MPVRTTQSIGSFASATSFADIAALVQTALRACTGATGSESVTYTSGRFVVDIGAISGGGDSIGPGTAGTTTAPDSLGLSESAGAVTVPGGAAETIGAALDAIALINSDFYFVALESSLNGTVSMGQASAWAGSNGRRFAAESNEGGALTASETASQAATLSALAPTRAFGTWSAEADYKSLMVAGAFSAVDWDGVDSLITAKFLRLPGAKKDDLTSTQRSELARKNWNYYTPEFGVAIYKEGKNLDGSWIDDGVWLDWIVGEIQLAEFNHFLAARRVP